MGVVLEKIYKFTCDMCKEIINMIYPRRCPVCDNILSEQGVLCCQNCRKELKYIHEPFCKKCGKPIEKDAIEYCFDCSKKEKNFVRGRAVFIYDDKMRESIVRFKYKGKREYGQFYGQEIVNVLGKYISELKVDAIIPVPIHKERYNNRGYNQADIIARYVGDKLGIQVISDGLKRKVNTVAQKELDNKERNKNLYNAFESNIKQSVLDNIKKVLIIDDIYTTGATIDACAKALCNNKNIEVYFVTLTIGRGK